MSTISESAAEAPRFSFKDLKHPSVWSTVWRQFRYDDMSIVHAVVGMTIALISIFIDAPTLKVWEWAEPGNYFEQPTSRLQALCFSFTILYFFYDTTWIFIKAARRPKFALSVEDGGYLFHHFACVFGLIFPIIHGHDGALGIIGFIIGELSNPPRAVADFIAWELAEMRQQVLTRGQRGLQAAGFSLEEAGRAYAHLYGWRVFVDAHFGSFVACRVYLVKFVASYMFPMCVLTTSKVAAVLVLVFSLGSVVFILGSRKQQAKEHQEIHIAPFAVAAAAAAKDKTA